MAYDDLMHMSDDEIDALAGNTPPRERHATTSPRRGKRPRGIMGRRSRRAVDDGTRRHRSRWRALARCNRQAAADWQRMKDTRHGADQWANRGRHR